ncbi:MAG: porin family protein [Candidatus Limisoma sp.]
MKRLAILILIITTVVTAWSRNRLIDTSAPEKPLTIGLRAGLNSSGIGNNYLSQLPELIQGNFYWRMGGQAGAVVDLNIRRYFAIETGLLWEVRKYEGSLMAANADEDYMGSMFLRARAHYMSIPAMASFRLNLGGQAKCHLDAGVYYAYGIAGKRESDQYYAFSDVDGQLIFDHKATSTKYFKAGEKDFMAIKHADFGLRFGTGMTFFNHYFIGVYYQHGLRNVAKNSAGAPDIKIRNRNWNVSLGYNF